MKKKYIQLGAVALILLAMVGALMFLRSQPDVSKPETPAANDIIYVFGGTSPEEPIEINIHNEYGDFVIDKNKTADTSASGLTIKGWESLSLDDYSLGQAASNAKSMIAKQVISENATAEELKTFGLDNPRASVTARFQNADNTVILFGLNAPGSEGVYVKLKDENKIYLVSDSMALPYFKPATAYVNKTITATDPEFKGFDKITLSGANYPEPIVIERTPEDVISAGGISLNTHAIISPIKRSIDSQKGLEPLSTVYGLLANDVVAVDDSDAVLEKYGLKVPATVISVVGDTPEMTFTLSISDPDANGEVHLIRNSSKVIYELSASALPFLSLSLFDMMDKLVIVPNIANVSKVILTTPAKTYEFVLTHQEEDNKVDVTLNGVPLPDVTDEKGKAITGGENFRKLYQTIIVCKYNEPMPNPETGAEVRNSDANFLASIEYIYNNGNPPNTVSLYSGPPRKMEIRLNGEGGYYGQTIYLDRLLEDVEKTANGIAVTPYL